MTRVWFVVPVHGREALTRVCLRQLRRTCDAATNVEATAVVIGEGPLLDFAYELGFATVERDNDALGRRFNDGFQLACDPAYNPSPADYVIPCGSDDWIDPVILREMPTNAVGVFRRMAVVNEERTELTKLNVRHKTAAGPKIIPAAFIAATGYRPSEEDRRRAIDCSTIEGIKAALGVWPPMVGLDVHGLQIVDWKSHGEQLNSYAMLCGHRHADRAGDLWAELAEFYPSEAIEEMRELDLVAA